MKKILILLMVILFCNTVFAYKINFKKNDTFFTVSIDVIPEKYSIAYYDYGINVLIQGVSIKDMQILKFKNDAIVRAVPLTGDKALIKVQYPGLKDLRNHVKVVIDKLLKIEIFKDAITVNKPVETIEKKDVADKSIVDIATKELNVIPKEAKSSTIANNKLKESEKVQSAKVPVAIKPKKTESRFSFNNNSDKKEPSFSTNILKTYSVLFILCILIVGGGIFFKKFYAKISYPLNSDIIKVLYKKDIMPKKTILIAKILNDYYILGATQSSISMIDKIASDSLKEELQLLEGEKEKGKFINYLKEQEKAENIDKEKMIKFIQLKLKEYRKNSNNVS